MAAEEPLYSNTIRLEVHSLSVVILCLVDMVYMACPAVALEDLFVWEWEWIEVGHRKEV